ncbi:MAG: hypothetical protein VB959_08915, partial [Rhodospirillales bacterium]
TEFEVAPGAIEFLSWAVENFNCHWLTSRSHDGTHDEIERAFRFALPATHLPDNIRSLIRSIVPARWDGKKIGGIDISRDFYWIDDDPDQASVDVLEKTGLLSRLILVSRDQRPDDLERLRDILEWEIFSHRRC